MTRVIPKFRIPFSTAHSSLDRKLRGSGISHKGMIPPGLQNRKDQTPFDCAPTDDDWFQAWLCPIGRTEERASNDCQASESGISENVLHASNIVAAIGRIVAMSGRLFPGPVAVEYSFDPENPADEYLVFDVVACGEYKDYRDREYEWHEEVRKIVPGSLGEFRLSVTPQR